MGVGSDSFPLGASTMSGVLCIVQSMLRQILRAQNPRQIYHRFSVLTHDCSERLTGLAVPVNVLVHKYVPLVEVWILA